MTINTIERDFREKVSNQVNLLAEGRARYRVLTPFRFEDGDHLAIVLKQEGGLWMLTDEGHTYMHLTYDLDENSLYRGTRQQIISNALTAFSVEDRAGELRVPIPDGAYGHALYDFVQALLKISDVAYLSRERAKSTFLEDFRTFIEDKVPTHRRQFAWRHPQLDPDGSYPVDCYINGTTKPLLVFALNNDNKTRDTTITLLQFERWGVPFSSVGIFENQEEINRKVLSRFSNVGDKQYSSLAGNRERIGRYLQEFLQHGSAI